MPVEEDLLSANLGTVTAPAGCGKTHLIGSSLARHSGPKPVLVLTHTVAGVAALRAKITTHGVDPHSYRLATIDGWSMRLVRSFPRLSKVAPACLELRNARVDYPTVLRGAAQVLRAHALKQLIRASYSRLLVDEYQDCSVAQHGLIRMVSQWLPTCVLGDPLQAIFDFRGDSLDWTTDVLGSFPAIGELTTPWRWINSGSTELGKWLLDVRRDLAEGRQFDIRRAPREVIWTELDGAADDARRFAAARIEVPTDHTVLIIEESTDKARQYHVARITPGATSVETADLKDMVEFAEGWNLLDPRSLARLCKFAMSVLTGPGVQFLVSRLKGLHDGSIRVPDSEPERKALVFSRNPTFRNALAFLKEFSRFANVRPHRPALLEGLIDAIRLCEADSGLTLAEAALRVREESRARGRRVLPRAVGSTLLLKGLEADAVVILNADSLRAKDLYVAMTRGSRLLIVCSQTPLLPSR